MNREFRPGSERFAIPPAAVFRVMIAGLLPAALFPEFALIPDARSDN
ncbi:hypothetical protein [Thalassobius sp. I31.1]|nr:hypothetical protein [Thalassobius sp. I31.1]